MKTIGLRMFKHKDAVVTVMQDSKQLVHANAECKMGIDGPHSHVQNVTSSSKRTT